MPEQVPPAVHPDVTALVEKIDRLLAELIQQQRTRAVKIAQRIQPNLSEDDLRDPHSFPQINSRPEFAYEDGMLAGLLAAEVAILREIGDHLRSSST